MHTMTHEEMLLAERAANILAELISSIESRDPGHREIAVLKDAYGSITHAAVRCIPRVNIEEVRHGA